MPQLLEDIPVVDSGGGEGPKIPLETTFDDSDDPYEPEIIGSVELRLTEQGARRFGAEVIDIAQITYRTDRLHGDVRPTRAIGATVMRHDESFRLELQDDQAA